MKRNKKKSVFNILDKNKSGSTTNEANPVTEPIVGRKFKVLLFSDTFLTLS